MTVGRGAVVYADLDPTLGHEQGGDRPCVVISDDAVAAEQRFPLLAIVPLTSTPGRGALYPPIGPGASSGLRNPSTALVDHVRAIDKRRVRRLVGRVSAAELAAIETGLRRYLGL